MFVRSKEFVSHLLDEDEKLEQHQASNMETTIGRVPFPNIFWESAGCQFPKMKDDMATKAK